MPDFSVFLTIFLMSAIQYFMATRNIFLFGFIVPVAFTVTMTWMFSVGKIESVIMYTVLLIVGLVILIGEWVRGRKSLKIRQKKELDSMKTKDL